MRPPMRKTGVPEELKSEITWGEARTRSSLLVHPKVALWARKEYPNIPYFVHVIDRDHHIKNHEAKMALPAPFAEERYLNTLDKEVTLEDVVNGSTWRVSFQAPGGYEHWSTGWPEFAQKNNLHRGNIVLFLLVSRSRFLFTVFNGQGCQIVPPASRAKQEVHVSSEEEECGVVSSLHSPSCPKHFTRRVELQKLETNGADHSSHDADDDLPAQKIVGHNIACQAALMHNLQQQPRKRKFKASAAQDNHKICVCMGFSCGIHHREEKKRLVNKQREDSEIVLDQCQKALEQIQLAECLLDMTNHLPLVKERSAFSEMTDQTNSDRVEPTTDHNIQVAHLNPIWFTFMSKRRVVTKVERREAKNAASRYSRTLRRPHCMAVMQESHVYREFIMGLPKALVLLGGDIVFPQPALTLVDSIGRSWEVQWHASGRHRLALVPKDWALFAVHHFLEEGDACVFEATDIQALTILVRIFRVVDIPDNLGTDSIYTHYSVEPVT